MAAERSPYAQFQFAHVLSTGPDLPESFVLDSVALCTREGAELWTRKLPDRWRRRMPIERRDLDAYLDQPWQRPPGPFIGDVHYRDGAVAFADQTGVLALSRDGGTVLLDAEMASPRDVQDRFWFDDGAFRVLNVGEGRCKGGQFFAPCGDLLLYFNTTVLAVVDPKTWAVTRRTRYDPKIHDRPAGTCKRKAVIRIGSWDVEFAGVIFV